MITDNKKCVLNTAFPGPNTFATNRNPKHVTQTAAAFFQTKETLLIFYPYLLLLLMMYECLEQLSAIQIL